MPIRKAPPKPRQPSPRNDADHRDCYADLCYDGCTDVCRGDDVCPGGYRRVGGVAGCGGWSRAPQKVYLFFLVLEFFLRVLNRFWIFVPATPATHALFVGTMWIWSISMLALYVYSFLLLGRKLPRAHAGPSESVEMTEESKRCWSLIRREIPRHLRGAEGAELLRGQGPRLLRDAVVWRPGNRRHRLLHRPTA